MLPPPALPPLFTGHAAPATADLSVLAAEGAAAGRYGAGDLLWSEATDVAAAALVLEPEGPLSEALQMLPLLMVAIGDALGAIGPPNLAIMYRWPATLLANGGEVGEVFFAAPQGLGLGAVPGYLVVGFRLALRLPGDLHDAPGHAAHLTALQEEGAEDVGRSELIGAVARHFLSLLDSWEHEGFAALRPYFLARLPEKREIAGRRLVGLDDAGGAVLEDGQVVPLAKALGVE